MSLHVPNTTIIHAPRADKTETEISNHSGVTLYFREYYEEQGFSERFKQEPERVTGSNLYGKLVITKWIIDTYTNKRKMLHTKDIDIDYILNPTYIKEFNLMITRERDEQELEKCRDKTGYLEQFINHVSMPYQDILTTKLVVAENAKKLFTRAFPDGLFIYFGRDNIRQIQPRYVAGIPGLEHQTEEKQCRLHIAWNPTGYHCAEKEYDFNQLNLTGPSKIYAVSEEYEADYDFDPCEDRDKLSVLYCTFGSSITEAEERYMRSISEEQILFDFGLNPDEKEEAKKILTRVYDGAAEIRETKQQLEEYKQKVEKLEKEKLIEQHQIETDIIISKNKKKAAELALKETETKPTILEKEREHAKIINETSIEMELKKQFQKLQNALQLSQQEMEHKWKIEEEERKRKWKIEEEERERKAKIEEEERKRKAKIEEEERKRKAKIEEEERKRRDEEHKKKMEIMDKRHEHAETVGQHKVDKERYSTLSAELKVMLGLISLGVLYLTVTKNSKSSKLVSCNFDYKKLFSDVLKDNYKVISNSLNDVLFPDMGDIKVVSPKPIIKQETYDKVNSENYDSIDNISSKVLNSIQNASSDITDSLLDLF